MSETTKHTLSPLVLIFGLSALFFIVFIIISSVWFFNGSTGRMSQPVSKKLFGSNGVGVIEINGVILDSKKILQKLERFEENDTIKGIVLRVNSPGGAVAPSQEIYEAVKKYSKPVVTSIGSVGASGAYYIACGTKKIFASQGTLTGSIGVIMEFVNLEKLYEWAKVKRYSIKTGRFKEVGAEYQEMTDEERVLVQTMVDDVLVQFKKAVGEGRHLTAGQVDAIADGRVLTGNQAKQAKLIDEFGSLKEAIDEIAKMSGIKGKPQIIYPTKKRKKLLDLLWNDDETEDNYEMDSDSSLATRGGDGIAKKFLEQILGNA
ncbi:MAG: signal peptide peptidase SppA, partial [Deltaproteobacteria bacterium]|nr:signal peptide peptidase SppA [Deltaproteobacteria bacterium]